MIEVWIYSQLIDQVAVKILQIFLVIVKLHQ